MIKYANDHIKTFINIDETMRILRKNLEILGELLISQLLMVLK